MYLVPRSAVHEYPPTMFVTILLDSSTKVSQLLAAVAITIIEPHTTIFLYYERAITLGKCQLPPKLRVDGRSWADVAPVADAASSRHVPALTSGCANGTCDGASRRKCRRRTPLLIELYITRNTAQ